MVIEHMSKYLRISNHFQNPKMKGGEFWKGGNSGVKGSNVVLKLRHEIKIMWVMKMNRD